MEYERFEESMSSCEPKIKEKHKAFAIAYCGEALGNAEKAALIAGYSASYARGNAYKLVANEGVKRYIEWLNSGKLVADIATIEEIQSFWTSVMRSGHEKTFDRLKASELLAKVKAVEEW